MATYVETDPLAKLTFNEKVVSRAMAHMKTCRLPPKVTVMDAAGCKTSRHFIKKGYKGKIHAFTKNKRDFAAMGEHKQIRKRCVDGIVKYSGKRRRSQVVIDDGMSNWRNTKPRMKILFEHCTTLALAINLTQRNKYHRYAWMLSDMIKMADKNGLELTEYADLGRYQQGGDGMRMYPHWFVFRSKEIFIDLTL